jgi:hypothetical protein
MPLMHAERALYLNAIFKARQAIEEARSTLAKACERLERRPVLGNGGRQRGDH